MSIYEQISKVLMVKDQGSQGTSEQNKGQKNSEYAKEELDRVGF